MSSPALLLLFKITSPPSSSSNYDPSLLPMSKSYFEYVCSVVSSSDPLLLDTADSDEYCGYLGKTLQSYLHRVMLKTSLSESLGSSLVSLLSSVLCSGNSGVQEAINELKPADVITIIRKMIDHRPFATCEVISERIIKHYVKALKISASAKNSESVIVSFVSDVVERYSNFALNCAGADTDAVSSILTKAIYILSNSPHVASLAVCTDGRSSGGGIEGDIGKSVSSAKKKKKRKKSGDSSSSSSKPESSLSSPPFLLGDTTLFALSSLLPSHPVLIKDLVNSSIFSRSSGVFDPPVVVPFLTAVVAKFSTFELRPLLSCIFRGGVEWVKKMEVRESRKGGKKRRREAREGKIGKMLSDGGDTVPSDTVPSVLTTFFSQVAQALLSFPLNGPSSTALRGIIAAIEYDHQIRADPRTNDILEDLLKTVESNFHSDQGGEVDDVASVVAEVVRVVPTIVEFDGGKGGFFEKLMNLAVFSVSPSSVITAHQIKLVSTVISVASSTRRTREFLACLRHYILNVLSKQEGMTHNPFRSDEISAKLEKCVRLGVLPTETADVLEDVLGRDLDNHDRVTNEIDQKGAASDDEGWGQALSNFTEVVLRGLIVDDNNSTSIDEVVQGRLERLWKKSECEESITPVSSSTYLIRTTHTLFDLHTRCMFYLGDPGVRGGGMEQSILPGKIRDHLLDGDLSAGGAPVETAELCMAIILQLRAGMLKDASEENKNDSGELSSVATKIVGRTVQLAEEFPVVFETLSRNLSFWVPLSDSLSMEKFLRWLLEGARGEKKVRAAVEIINDQAFYGLKSLREIGGGVVADWIGENPTKDKYDVVEVLVRNCFLDSEHCWRVVEKVMKKNALSSDDSSLLLQECLRVIAVCNSASFSADVASSIIRKYCGATNEGRASSSSDVIFRLGEIASLSEESELRFNKEILSRKRKCTSEVLRAALRGSRSSTLAVEMAKTDRVSVHDLYLLGDVLRFCGGNQSIITLCDDVLDSGEILKNVECAPDLCYFIGACSLLPPLAENLSLVIAQVVASNPDDKIACASLATFVRNAGVNLIENIIGSIPSPAPENYMKPFKICLEEVRGKEGREIVGRRVEEFLGCCLKDSNTNTPSVGHSFSSPSSELVGAIIGKKDVLLLTPLMVCDVLSWIGGGQGDDDDDDDDNSDALHSSSKSAFKSSSSSSRRINTSYEECLLFFLL